jgi:glutathione synthase/RimK-type ligase-like ATP-grasp enzyme
MKLGILKSFDSIQMLVDQYCEACKELGVDYTILDLLSENWIEEIKQANVDGILVRIKGNLDEHKNMFDERLFIINEELGIPIYPSRKELFLYENKRLYEYWLTANGYPHPKTNIFYKKKDALEFLKTAKMPLVFKTNGGATSSGVQIVKSKVRARYYIHQIFGIIDYRLSLGKTPWKKGGIPIPKFGMTQKHYVIMQEYIPLKWEWRIIKIGNSYFGKQKLLKGYFASGVGVFGWVTPPKELLLMVKSVCDKGNFDCMAMDVLESKDGKYYINELQSLFGTKTPYMKINGEQGRYILINDEFIFEKGEFNKMGGNILRVEDFIKKIKSGYYNNFKPGKDAEYA